MSMSSFLDVPESEWLASNALAFAVRTRETTRGHTVIATRRAVPTWFDATQEEKVAIVELIDVVKEKLQHMYEPDGFNVGFDTGEPAGQTVMRLHVHVIPRRLWDMGVPRGVRDILIAKYPPVRTLATGGERDPFLRHIAPLFETSTTVDIIAAFVQVSGLDSLRPYLDDSLTRGAHVRLLTGDYLHITQAAALQQLLDWMASETVRDELLESDDRDSTPHARRGRLEVRVLEVESLPPRSRAFHPKSWRFAGPGGNVLFVGSSNISRSALETGIEWNLRIDEDRDAKAVHEAYLEFERLWKDARAIDGAFVEEYAARARAYATLPIGEDTDEELPAPPDPHEIQAAALAALRRTREEGRRRGLVVLATGLGKTWLSAFDVAAFEDELRRRPRVLFLAHRAEILRQASRTFRILLRTRHARTRVAWFAESAASLDGDVVFASVQKLARPEHLARIDPETFDYVVIDEVHHATADSYRRVLGRLRPRFVLGLTATPERTDEADVLGLFDDNLVYRADLAAGIRADRLVPFHYFGLKDDVDYENIPWRNKRFDPAELARAVQTDRRMQHMWTAWQAHPSRRTLVFCASIEHATYVRAWLRARGVEARAVHSDDTSDPRTETLDALAAGTVDAVCSVDVFNEGIDVPTVDRVVMLRPTESPVVFLQQLGRGLRKAAGDKTALTVIDFVGNHRVFLDRVRRLLSLAAHKTSVRDLVDAAGPLELPDGCSIDVELEAKELLAALLPKGQNEVERIYRELRRARGERPRAGELQRLGYNPSSLTRAGHATWLEFVESEGDLDDAHKEAHHTARAFLRDLETKPTNDASELLALQALLEADALTTGGSMFPFRIPVAPGRENELDDLLRELVDWRLAKHRARTDTAPPKSFDCRVMWNQRDPILKLPPRAKHPDLPQGDTHVRLPDGSSLLFRFQKEFINVAHAAGDRKNRLPDLLRSFYGPNAGRPGTDYRVRFESSPDGLWLRRLGEVVDLGAHRRLYRAHPDLRAAAGAATAPQEEIETDRVALPIDREGADLFAVRAAGSSMHGGPRPIADGDWLLMKYARGLPLTAIEGRVALVETPDPTFGIHYQVKRIARTNDGWELRSDNPDAESYPATADTIPIAILLDIITPETLAPTEGTLLTDDDLATAFRGISIEAPPKTGRIDGHLFLFIDQRGAFTDPDRILLLVARHPGETAFVHTRPNAQAPWRYAGVARWSEAEERWTVPALDFETWRALGNNRRTASRRLPPGAEERASRFIDQLLTTHPIGTTITDSNQTLRIKGRSPKGGLRIDGGENGFKERTISLTDIAWTLVAAEDVATNGGLLDEARVNKLRYLEGTPKDSTRWIDTGWCIVLARVAKTT